MHEMKQAPLRWLHAVAQIGQRAIEDHRFGVSPVALGERVDDVGFIDDGAACDPGIRRACRPLRDGARGWALDLGCG